MDELYDAVRSLYADEGAGMIIRTHLGTPPSEEGWHDEYGRERG